MLAAQGLLARKARRDGLERARMGEDELGSRFKSGDGVLSCCGFGRGPRGPRISCRRIWLHHVHRDSGPLPDEIDAAIDEGELIVGSVLSGNRNFEGASTPR